MDLGDGGCFRGRKCNFGIYGPIWSFYTLKCSQKDIKVGNLSQLLGFEVTEWIKVMEAVLKAENVTLALINRFGRFILQNVHKKR